MNKRALLQDELRRIEKITQRVEEDYRRRKAQHERYCKEELTKAEQESVDLRVQTLIRKEGMDPDQVDSDAFLENRLRVIALEDRRTPNLGKAADKARATA
eukprot:CAMPEP_0185788446 /NCGR_PEP_ID=MMETSP1174-20130828/146094_1 /TAXON_ID=35687 /ORGANISM="Dictyocha speculum, Strain CCMP1381" /LENGTH=100 /DNA_ID=CAMNT_0028482135 /DNA_START=1 /DNA_END=299 /DNA_ORIENTATION=+